MSQETAERGVAKCGRCGQIHTVAVERGGSIRLLGIGRIDRCSCGGEALTVLDVDLETPPAPDPAPSRKERLNEGYQ